MRKSTDPNESFDETPRVAGDADAVEGTTTLAGKGTDDRANRRAEQAGETSSDADRDAPDRRGTEGT